MAELCKQTKLNWFVFILVIIVSAVCCTPILGKTNIFVAIGGAILVVAFVDKQIWGKKNFAVVGPIFLYLFVIFTYKYLGFSSAAWGNYMHQCIFFASLLLTVLVIEKVSDKQLKWIWWILMGICVFSIVNNILLSVLYPTLRTARDRMDEDLLRSLNAGSSIYYTYTLFFYDICLFVFLNVKNKMVKWLMLAISIVAAVFIVWYCLKGSVVVFFLLSTVLLLVAKRAKNKTLFLGVSVFFTVMLLIIVNVFQEEIISFILAAAPNERLSTRLITLIDPDHVGANAATVTGRTNLYRMSIETWLSGPSSFLFGIGDHRVAHGAATTGISQHAELLDTLARYGCVGIVVLTLFFKRFWVFVSSLFDKTYNLQMIVIFFIFLSNGFTKQVFHPEIGFVLFFLWPFSSKIIKQYNA